MSTTKETEVEKVRAALVGMNVIGQPLAKGVGNDPRAQIVALCDVVEERTRAFAAELPGTLRCYTEYTEVCRDPDVDAVLIATPNQWHVPIGLEAVRHGKHVLIIKPLADSLVAAHTLVTAAEQAGVVNMMALSLRFGADAQYLGRLVATGGLGEIYYARARSLRRSGIPIRRPGFIQKGGGAFRDMGVHLLDAAWWMMGMPRPVSVTGVSGARFGPRGIGYMTYEPQPEAGAQFAVDDYGGGFIRFANGVGLQIESFWAGHQPDEMQIELLGNEGGARLMPLTLYRTVDNAPADTTITLPKGIDVWDRIGSHFVACILDGMPCEAPLRHGLIVQEMLEALLESADTGEEVKLTWDASLPVRPSSSPTP
jgi:predicted dehydrogenase